MMKLGPARNVDPDPAMRVRGRGAEGRWGLRAARGGSAGLLAEKALHHRRMLALVGFPAPAVSRTAMSPFLKATRERSVPARDQNSGEGGYLY